MIGIMVSALLNGCGSQGNAAAESTAGTMAEQEVQAETTAVSDAATTGGGEGNVLIAYFAVAENSEVDAVSSASVVATDEGGEGRMQYLAELIQAETRGDLFSIQTAVDYPGDIGELIDYAAVEQDENERPELTSHIENLDQYDVVFVGFPTWWYDMPQALYSFFDEYDFSGKTIIPFNSHNGSRFSGTIETIAELEPEAKVITEGLTVHEGDVADAGAEVADWLAGLDV